VTDRSPCFASCFIRSFFFAIWPFDSVNAQRKGLSILIHDDE
jgi:hypothetical protein